MPAGAIDFRGINETALRNNVRGFLQSLIPGGRFRSLEYIVRNPRRSDQSLGSFKVNYRSGVWKDFASGEGGGDLISLVAYIRGIGQGEAARALADELGTQVSSVPDPASRVIDAPSAHIVVPVPSDAPPIPTEHFDLGEPARIWWYLDAAGGLLGYVCRFEPPEEKKQYWPLTLHRINGELKWRWKSWPAPRPLYGLDQLAQRPSARVLVVEGEKAADAARKLLPDFVVVTSPNGSHAAEGADWSPLRDRDAIIWPDADEPGDQYKTDVIGCLTSIGAKSVTAVTPPAGVKESWDAADALYEDGWTPERAIELIADVPCAEASPLISDSPDASEPVSEEKTNQEIKRLSSLPLVQYDRERTEAAKRLGIRASVLDGAVKSARPVNGDTKGQGRPFEMPTIEPWPEAINGAELLDDVAAAIKLYVVMPANSADTLALWAVHTHCFKCFAITPRAAIRSPVKRCGKTTLLDVLKHLVARPLFTSNFTAAVAFRVVEMATPTLLVDEADQFLSDKSELQGILNDGHRRGGQTLRNVGDNHEPRQFSTWTPLAIAMIGQLPDTLADRAVDIPLRRRTAEEKVKLFRSDRADDLNVLARKMARWAQDHQKRLTEADPDTGKLFNRVADNWRPLLAIADLAGGHWPKRAREITAEADNANDDQSAPILLLQDIRWIFDGRPDENGKETTAKIERLSSADLVGRLVAIEGRPWGEWRRGSPMTQNSLARLLKKFDIGPIDIHFSTGTLKGYYRSALDDVFARYLSPHPPNSTAIIPHNRDNLTISMVYTGFPTATENERVAVGKATNQLTNNDYRGVADENGLEGGNCEVMDDETWEDPV